MRAVAPRADSGRLREEPGLQLPGAPPGARAKTRKRRGDAVQRPAARGEVGWGSASKACGLAGVAVIEREDHRGRSAAVCARRTYGCG